MDIDLAPAIPILRMHDVAVTKRFYLDYLACSLDWEDGEGDSPVYMQVSRGELVLHLSSHHDDGTPGSAVLVETRGVDALWAELRERDYPSSTQVWSPGQVGGRASAVDPASNRVRFYERLAP